MKSILPLTRPSPDKKLHEDSPIAFDVIYQAESSQVMEKSIENWTFEGF